MKTQLSGEKDAYFLLAEKWDVVYLSPIWFVLSFIQHCILFCCREWNRVAFNNVVFLEVNTRVNKELSMEQKQVIVIKTKCRCYFQELKSVSFYSQNEVEPLLAMSFSCQSRKNTWCCLTKRKMTGCLQLYLLCRFTNRKNDMCFITLFMNNFVFFFNFEFDFCFSIIAHSQISCN